MSLRPSIDDVYAVVRDAVLANDHTPDRIGIEAEWFPLHISHLGRARIDETADPIRKGSDLTERRDDNPSFVNSVGGAITFEPGGQLEHSGVAHDTIPGAFGELADTHRVLTRALDAAEIMLVPAGIDHWNHVAKVDQQLIGPRYPAMADFFDARRSTGPLMMKHTASLQINLDAGIDTLAQRWVLANRLSPLLTASFSTSPSEDVHSARARIWQNLDPTRTGLPGRLDPDADPVEFLTRRALEADVLVAIRNDTATTGTPGHTLAEWLTQPHPRLGVPTVDDVRYHLTTLFPEVRLRKGVLELRGIDGLPDRWCVFPAVLMAGALYDDSARGSLLDITADVDAQALWFAAAGDGMADPGVASLARKVWQIALEGAGRLGEAVTGDISPTAEFVERRLGVGNTFGDEIRRRLSEDADRTAFWLASR